MPSYKFSARSQADLENIVRYTVETWGTVQANTYIDGLERICQSLADNPKLGSSRGDLYTGLRGFLYESHILYYVEDDHGITVVRLLHQSMDETAQFE